MAAEEDNFDIDIYGDGIEEQAYNAEPGVTAEVQTDSERVQADPNSPNPMNLDGQVSPTHKDHPELKNASQHEEEGPSNAQKILSTDNSSSEPVQLPKQAPQAQGVDRQTGSEDERYMDPGATTALLLSELHWWINDDDIRGWANQCRCEDELLEITFSEHKVNGKSKGQAYVLLKSPQAATAIKQKIESFGEDEQKEFSAGFTNPYTNPFKTLPKDGPMRNGGAPNGGRSASSNVSGSGPGQANGGYNNSGGYRGGRGGYGNRGGGMGNSGGFNRGGFNQSGSGGFQGSAMGGFQNNMGNMQSYGGFQNRGGMMGGMRGGGMGMRGGRGNMMGMPFNGMGFGAMGMGMNMPQMAASMGMPGQGNFGGGQNPFGNAMFNQQQGDMNWNPHGAKRTRQE